MTLDELEEALAEIMPGFRIETDDRGELIVYSGLRQEDDGELVDMEEDEDDPDFDEDFEPLEEEDEDEEI